MRRTPLHRLGSLAAGLVAGGLATLAVDPALAGAIGLCTATSAMVLLRIRREYPDRVAGDAWADKRWTGLTVAVITGAALLGLVLVPVSAEYRFALQMLALLVGMVGYLGGSLAEMERDANRESGGERTAAAADD